MFLIVAFLIFTGALFGAGYMVWHVPQQETEEVLSGRLRELRARSGSVRTRTAGDLLKREKRGPLAALGDFVSWVGVLRRLQLHIDQANLKYRAAEVFTLAVLIAVLTYVVSGFIVPMYFLRVLLAAGLGAIPIFYINFKR